MPLFLFTRETQNLAAEFEAPQEALKPLRIGDLAEIESDSVPGRVLNGRITEISAPAAGGGASVIGRLIIEAPKSDSGFAVGSTVTVTIEIRQERRSAEAARRFHPARNVSGPE